MAYSPVSARGIDLSASRQPAIWAAIITTYVLAVVFVALRLLARRLIRVSYLLDDWLLLAALLSLTLLLGDTIYGLEYGVGKHVELFGPDVYKHFFISLFVGWIFYATTICLVKFSILALYWRIFQYSSIRMPILVLTGIVSGWGIATIITTVFQCHPISSFWNRTEFPGSCNVEITPFFMSISAVNIVTDIAVLVLPIRYVLTLQRNVAQKAITCGIFLSGSLVCIVATIRTAYLVKDNASGPDFTWDYSNVAMWTVPECAVAVISACLPSLRPIIRYLTGHAAQEALTTSISMPASGTAASYLSNKDSRKSTCVDDEHQRQQLKNDENQPQKALPQPLQIGEEIAPEDIYSVMGYEYDTETGRWRNDGVSSSTQPTAEVTKEQQKAHIGTESPSWYEESDDSGSLADPEERDSVLGEATREMSVFYNL